MQGRKEFGQKVTSPLGDAKELFPNLCAKGHRDMGKFPEWHYVGCLLDFCIPLINFLRAGFYLLWVGKWQAPLETYNIIINLLVFEVPQNSFCLQGRRAILTRDGHEPLHKPKFG